MADAQTSGNVDDEEAGVFVPLMSADKEIVNNNMDRNRSRVEPYVIPTDYSVEPDYPTNYRQDFHNLDREKSDNNVNYPSSDEINSEGTLVRRRKASSGRRYRSDSQYDDWEDGDGTVLPSMRFQKRSRTKSLKERRQEHMDEKEHENESETLNDRFREMKRNNDVSAQNLATLVRDTTLNRMKGINKDSKTFRKFKMEYKNVLQRFSIWFHSFKVIEGKFGTATMTFFRFIKWLMFLNLYITIIMFGVTTVPFLVLGPFTYEESLPDSSVAGYYTSINCTTEYINHVDNITSSSSVADKVLDVLQGTGWMERKILFIGVYHNKTYYSGGNKQVYDMGLAYLLGIGACYIISFILLVRNAAKNMKVTLGIETTVAKYSNKVFAGWDYCIKEQKGAKVKSKSIKTEIVSDLREESEKRKRSSYTTTDRCQLYTIRLIINIVTLGMLVGACWLIAYTADRMLDLLKQDLSEILRLLVQYVPYITITVLNLILPIIFEKLAGFERYFHETEIKVTLARSILLRLASPVVLIAILYTELIANEGESESQCGNKKWSADTGGTLKGSVKCWETNVGQQIYKLVLLDLIVETVIVIFVQYPRRIVYNRYKHNAVVNAIGPQEFNIPQNVVDIIYSQSLCWLGMFFSPLIPLMTFLKCFLFFYIRKLTLLHNCQAQERPFRTSRSNSLFMTVLLLSFILSAVPIGYMISSIPPSQSCGPFRLYETKNATMFNTITNTVSNWPGLAKDIFSFLGTVGFFVPVIILLCLMMYYYWLLGVGYKKTEKLLQQQLVTEGKDKKFLLARVSEYQQLKQLPQTDDVFQQSNILAAT